MKGHSTFSRLLFQELQRLSAFRNRLCRDVQCSETCTLQVAFLSSSRFFRPLPTVAPCCLSAPFVQWKKESAKKKPNGQNCALSALKSSAWARHEKARPRILRRWPSRSWPMACKKERWPPRFREKASRCWRAAASIPTHWCWRGVPKSRVWQALRSALLRLLMGRSYQEALPTQTIIPLLMYLRVWAGLCLKLFQSHTLWQQED